MMNDNQVIIGDIKYLYNPFELVIYEIYVQQILENMFGEPDEIYAKTRVYADENGVKDSTRSWESVKSIATYSYLGNDLTDKKTAITAFQKDIGLKQAKLEDKLKCAQELLKNLNVVRKAMNSSGS